MRVVLDTNVLLAGFATHGICEGIVTISYRDHSVVLSDYILHEFAEHYVGKFKASAEQAATVVEILRQQSEMALPASVPSAMVTDADDLPVLGTAIAGQADCLVTGDGQLLALGDVQGIPILSPRAYYDLIRVNG